MPPPITASARGLDLSPRFFRSVVVVASPAAASETIIGSVTCTEDLAINAVVEVLGWAAWTVGTSGTASTLRIRQTNVAGTVVASSGALPTAAAVLVSSALLGFDTAATSQGQVYVLTLTVTAGAASSTVSAVGLRALVV